jgi:hypothetical protein
MSDKERVTVNLDAVNVEWIDARCNNRSAFLNELVDEARTGGAAAKKIMSEFERRRLKAQAEVLQSQYETIQEQITELDEREEAREKAREADLDDAAEALKETELKPTNPAVKTQAEKVALTEPELIEEVKKRHP